VDVLVTVLAADEVGARSVVTALQREGAQVCQLSAAGLAEASSTPATLVVIIAGDRAGPAAELCTRVREWSDAPIVMLSASRQDSDELLAFSAGCDDYIRTPCREAIVAARLRRHLHRSRLGANTGWRHGGLVLDPAERRVTVDGTEVLLTRTEFEILEILIENPRHVVTRAHILDRVWHGCSPGDHTLEVHLSRLRAKILRAGGPLVGHPVPGVGYRCGA
jgi:DNA-binding response OmpR family regulator